MRLKNLVKKFITTIAVTIILQPATMQITTYAAVVDYGNGIKFDAEFYAYNYPLVATRYGNDTTALLNHYLTEGVLEGFTAYEDQDLLEIVRLKDLFTELRSRSDSTNRAATPAPSEVTAPTAAVDVTVPTAPADATVPVVPADATVPVPAEGGQLQTSKGLVLVYLNGTDLESNGNSGFEAVNQMIAASAAGNTRFVIMAGGTKTWKHPVMQNANNGNTVSYVVENGTIRELKQYGSTQEYLSSDMITRFIKDTKAAYTADHTSMVFWDHGGGAAGGYGSNEVTGKGMSASAVAAGVRNSGSVFESVGFDTCLMGSLEVASNFAGNAKYFVGSQELESGYGWNFGSFADYGTTDFVSFGKKLINDYDVYTKAKDSHAPYRTLALYDMNGIASAQSQWNDLVSQLGATKEGIEMMAIARDSAREFHYEASPDYRAGEIDLIAFLNCLEYTHVGQQSVALVNTLKNAVLYKNGNEMDQVNGISVYLPGENTWQYNNKYNDIKGNNISDSTMSAYDKLASIYAGQREEALFMQTSYDQKHDDSDPAYYRKAKWYNKEYGELATGAECAYKDVKNGGFAVESETGMTPQTIDSAELRVMLKDKDNRYISLGRTSTFCTTADKNSPVFNFNGQWLHINGQPVAAYQYDDFKAGGTGDHTLGIYTIAEVNGKTSKLDIQWNATKKKWGCWGYIPVNDTMSTKTKAKPFVNGDKIEFFYDFVKSGADQLKATSLFEPITYNANTFKLETRTIDTKDNDVLFYGTLTDTYGKTLCTPYFKFDPTSPKLTEATVKGSEPEIKPSNDRSIEKWVLKDGGEDSFLSCYYNPLSGAYESYNEETGAFNMILDTSDEVHYNEALGTGYYYDAESGLYYLMDEDGIIEGAEGMDAETFEEIFGVDPDDYDAFDLLIASYYESIGEYSDNGGSGSSGGSEYHQNSYQESTDSDNSGGGSDIDDDDDYDYDSDDDDDYYD